MKWSNRTSKRVLWLSLCDESSKVRANDNITVVLSPRWYNVKRVELPVKLRYQALKVAPSVFEGLLEEGKSYRFNAFRQENEWTFIAYDEEEIISALKMCGIEPKQVKQVCFAQEFIDEINVSAVRLNDKEVLAVIDGVVTSVPAMAYGDEALKSVDAIDVASQKGCIRLRGNERSLVPPRYVTAISVIVLLFAAIWFWEGYRIRQTSGDAVSRLEAFYQEHPSLRSTYAQQSIAKKYKTRDYQERKKREAVGKIAGLMEEGVTLESLELDQEKFRAILRPATPKAADALKQALRRVDTHMRFETEGDVVVVKGRL